MRLLRRILDFLKSKMQPNYVSKYKAISEANYLEAKIRRPKYTKILVSFAFIVCYALFLSLVFNVFLYKENRDLEKNLRLLASQIEYINSQNAKVVDKKTEFIEVEIIVEKSKDKAAKAELKTKSKDK